MSMREWFTLLPSVQKAMASIVAAVTLLGAAGVAGAAVVMHKATVDVTTIAESTIDRRVPGIVRSAIAEQAPALIDASVQPMRTEMAVGFATIERLLLEARLESEQRYSTKDEQLASRAELRAELARVRDQVRALTAPPSSVAPVRVPVVGDVWQESLDAE